MLNERIKVYFKLFTGLGLPAILLLAAFLGVMWLIMWPLSFLVGILPVGLTLSVLALLLVVHFLKKWRKRKADEELIYRSEL